MPPPATGPALSCPPWAAARSRMPTIPRPAPDAGGAKRAKKFADLIGAASFFNWANRLMLSLGVPATQPK